MLEPVFGFFFFGYVVTQHSDSLRIVTQHYWIVTYGCYILLASSCELLLGYPSVEKRIYDKL